MLWTGLSGYPNACLKELASRDGVELFVSHQKPVTLAPFDESQFAWIPNRLTWEKQPELDLLENRLEPFPPEIMIVPSWHVINYCLIEGNMPANAAGSWGWTTAGAARRSRGWGRGSRHFM